VTAREQGRFETFGFSAPVDEATDRSPIARGSAMESAAHLDVRKVQELIEDEQYAAGVGFLERIVAMLTKMIDP
jgi:hypothetical protein